MVEVRRLYLDTNVFVRWFEGNDELSRLLTKLIWSSAPREPQPFATSELTMAELLVAPYRNQDEDLIQRYDNWTISNGCLEVGPVNRDVLRYAAVLRAQYASLKLPDAIHVSTAIGFQCSHILSADARLSKRYELVHRRWGVTHGPAVVDVLRPDIPTIQTLIEQFAS